MSENEKARATWDQVAALHSSVEPVELGSSASFQYRVDPKHLCFVLSRYKFCAKMLTGKRAVLEVGCGDAVGTPIVAQVVDRVVGIDWDEDLVASNRRRLSVKNCEFESHDIVSAPVNGQFDAIYSLDVIEHVAPDLESRFMDHCCSGLGSSGILILGTPNLRADAYTSESSRLGHINLKDAKGLRTLLDGYFENVFVFSMNDEVVHTGFYEMGHYLFAMGVGLRQVSGANT